MTYRHNNTPRPTNTAQVAADAIRDRRAAERRDAEFAKWWADNHGDEYDADGTDARYEAMQVSDAEATYYERQLGIAS